MGILGIKTRNTVETLKEVIIMAKEVEMAEKCCLNCANLLTCEDILTYKCKRYGKAETDKSALSTRYLETVQRLANDVKELQLLEMGMKIAEKTDMISKIKERSSVPEGVTEKQFRNMLKETNMTVEDWEQLPTQTKENIIKSIQKKVKEPEEKPAISKRNKEIIALVEQGKGVKEIASMLSIKPETVEKELEYLLKNGMVKTLPS
jgi:ATP/maltotriose-dependent transcriptional regulator MalT